MSVATARVLLDKPQPSATHTQLHPELNRAHVRFIGVGKTYDGRQGPVDALKGIDWPLATFIGFANVNKAHMCAAQLRVQLGGVHAERRRFESLASNSHTHG